MVATYKYEFNSWHFELSKEETKELETKGFLLDEKQNFVIIYDKETKHYYNAKLMKFNTIELNVELD